MDTTTTSIFDLSPAEKLQLVEDLWDDLAATPEAVPVHDWQEAKKEMRKRFETSCLSDKKDRNKTGE